MQQHISTAHQTCLEPKHSTPQQSGIYSLTCKTCKLSYVGQTSRTWRPAFKSISGTLKLIIHSRPTPSIFSTIGMSMNNSWDNDANQSHPKWKHVTTLRAVPHTIPPPNRQAYTWTIPQWAEPSFSTGLQSPTPFTTQNRASKAVTRKPETQPSLPHYTDNLKTKLFTAYF
jgi:hypothetical protein